MNIKYYISKEQNLTFQNQFYYKNYILAYIIIALKINKQSSSNLTNISFFKRLFTSKKESNGTKTKINQVYSTTYFDNRYTEEGIEPTILDGCLKMIESYFIDNKIERKIESPINHPANLDQVDQDGFGFLLYCNAFQIEEFQATMFLAYAFSDFLMNRYGFKLYSDSKPEYPLRSMTLKYEKDEVFLSLYPFEYTSKVLKGNATFSDLAEKISSQIEEMPNIEDLIKNSNNANEKKL
ncbi:hypothetical protein [Flavobacterium sp. 2755]|uniref:hypothetical protein n=1 Tax=Flavobacterium sp. 2755 TaxID=2817765 RepID=UPI00286CADBB|nr:hypothetical protein [Flavobacterium sp. 2755]